MIRFAVAGFPVTVEPWFFLVAWMLGYGAIPDLPGQAVWIAAVFVGVLLHELGHAAAARRLGARPEITLHAMGGLTSWRPLRPMTTWQEVGVTAAGPAVGITVGVLLIAAQVALAPGGMAARAIDFAVWVNLGWGVLNLMPVLPLDGGTIVAAAAGAVAGRNGRLAARVLSVALTLALAVWALTAFRWFYLLLGAWLTAINWQALRRELAPPPAAEE